MALRDGDDPGVEQGVVAVREGRGALRQADLVEAYAELQVHRIDIEDPVLETQSVVEVVLEAGPIHDCQCDHKKPHEDTQRQRSDYV